MSNWVLVSKYHSLLKGTRVSERNGNSKLEHGLKDMPESSYCARLGGAQKMPGTHQKDTGTITRGPHQPNLRQ